MSLTDTQLVLLSGASQRDDRLITLPETLKGGAAKKAISKLISLTLAEEVGVKRDQPHWRVDQDEKPIGLKITAAGLAAIGIESQPASAGKAKPEIAKRKPAQPEAGKDERSAAAPAVAPRQGSKQALIISLLGRKNGATLDDLIE